MMSDKKMETVEMFGTKLRTSIGELNNEKELRRLGLEFDYDGRSIWIVSGPKPNANYANRLGVGEAISRHLSAGGTHLEWPLSDGTFQWMEITASGVRECNDPRLGRKVAEEE